MPNSASGCSSRVRSAAIRVRSASLRERLDNVLRRAPVLEDLGCIKEVDEHNRHEVLLALSRLAKASDTQEAVLIKLSRDAQLRRVTRDSFGRVLAEDPERTQELLRQLARRVREVSGRIAAGMAEGR